MPKTTTNNKKTVTKQNTANPMPLSTVFKSVSATDMSVSKYNQGRDYIRICQFQSTTKDGIIFGYVSFQEQPRAGLYSDMTVSKYNQGRDYIRICQFPSTTKIFEPPRDKTKNVVARPAKTQISGCPGLLILRWAHNHIVGFVTRRLIYSI